MDLQAELGSLRAKKQEGYSFSECFQVNRMFWLSP